MRIIIISYYLLIILNWSVTYSLLFAVYTTWKNLWRSCWLESQYFYQSTTTVIHIQIYSPTYKENMLYSVD